MSLHRAVPPPPPRPPAPDTTAMTGTTESSVPNTPPPSRLPPPTPPRSNRNNNSNSNSNANHQKRSPVPTRSYPTSGHRVPPPPPPPKSRRVPQPPPPPRRNNTSTATGFQAKRRRPIPPPPPPRITREPPRMNLDSSKELAVKAREMFHKCLNQSIPTGNLFSGGLGAYYLLLEQSRYHLMVLERQQMLSNNNNNNSHQNTPLKCKKLLKQALEGAQSATGRFKRNHSGGRSNISLLGGDWVGSHALLAVCYRRLEDFSKKQQDESGEHEAPGGSTAPVRTGVATRTSLFSSSRRKALQRTPSSTATVASAGGDSMYSAGMSTVATTNPRPRSERVVDKIFYRLEKQHLASYENDDDNLTYYTMNSNYTSNTMSSMAIAAVWNQDVLGGRAGALQAIWWLRKEFGDEKLGQDLVVSMALKILEEGLSTAASMGFSEPPEDLEEDDGEPEILFWVCDSQGSHKAYLGASRGVVGILHTLLGLSHGDWELVEEHIPNAKGCVQKTIDVFLPNETDNSSPQEEGDEKKLHERFLYAIVGEDEEEEQDDPVPASGNLRPRLDASEESDTTVDWFHGAAGLTMLLLEASKVFACKEYLLEAHRLCDAVIFPRGLAEQKRAPITGNTRSGREVGARNKKGPVGLAGMAICFLQLSELCSDDDANDESDNETEGEKENKAPGKAEFPSKKTSLKKVWMTRAALYAQHAHHEWSNYMKATPTINGSGNAYSLYEGMGGLISLLWQLSLSKTAAPEGIETIHAQTNVQLPLYGLGFVDSAMQQESEPMLLSRGDVKVSDTPEEFLRLVSQPKLRSPTESRRRRALAEAQAKQRSQKAEEAERLRVGQVLAERAVQKAQRRAELESRKQAQLAARKKALEVARQKKDEESKNAAKKEAEEKCKREAVLLARRQAKERADARRKAKEEEERTRARAEEQRRAAIAENKRKAAEEEAKKRKALAEARLRRQKKEDEWSKQKEEEQKQKDELDRMLRAEELKRKEEQRKKRLEELRLQKQREAQIAKEQEIQRTLREEVDREKRAKELKLKAEERKKQELERKRRMELLKERRKKEELELADKKAKEAQIAKETGKERLMKEKADRQRRAQIAKEKERERVLKEKADRERRAKEFKLKEEERKEQDTERKRRLAFLRERKRKEQEALAQFNAQEADGRKSAPGMALEAKGGEERKSTRKSPPRRALEAKGGVERKSTSAQQDAERRSRLAFLRERKRKEEEALAQFNAQEAEEMKSPARKELDAKEKRRLQLREERLQKKKEIEQQRQKKNELEEQRLREELQQALDKEVEKQRREEKIRREGSEEDLKMLEAINAIHQLDSPMPAQAPPPALKAAYSPSFAEKKHLGPSHFSAPTRNSLFWSLQTDSNIGSSENYKPALVAADSPPSSTAISESLE